MSEKLDLGKKRKYKTPSDLYCVIETIDDGFPETDWKIMHIGASTIVFCTLVTVL